MVVCGVKETAHTAPDFLISWTWAARRSSFTGSAVDLLEELGHLLLGRGDDVFQHRIGVVVAGVEALAVEHRQAAHLVHPGGEAGRDRAVHGRGHNGNLELQVADGHLGGSELGVDGHLPGNDGNFVETVGALQFLK